MSYVVVEMFNLEFSCMPSRLFKSNLSQLYLTLVPVLTIVFGLGIGYVSYKVYVPIWLINVVLMGLSTWVLGAHVITIRNHENKQMAACGLCFIIPTMLSSMFSGLGAPPFEDPKAWVSSGTEQLTRYYFLLAMGLLIAFGSTILREMLKKTRGNFYALLGLVAIQIATPIYLIDMSFWGFYITKLYRSMVASSIEKMPDWFPPLRSQFFYINILVAALVYMATAAFAMSLKKADWFKPIACNVYICISLLLLLFDILPPTLPEPLGTLN